MKTADLYIRVSTDEQADKGYSQRDQAERLEKYCQDKGIMVRKVIFEDHSAKTFDRPAWTNLLLTLRKQRGQTDLILFTKWDRFSRNAPDAYNMIRTLKSLGVEPQAIEQPLDMDVPENKMMLAIYLTAPEIENDRRGLNTFHGLRRARKEGRWIGLAPTGYINRTAENGKKYIALHGNQADLMAWAFKELSKGKYSIEQVFKKAVEMGLVCSKNNFLRQIRNTMYCGIIQIPSYKDEQAYTVRGLHEPIISPSLFYQVQDVISGKKNDFKTKILSDENVPLKGFLTCSRCTRTLCGSASKGRNAYYYYYHCSSACGCRLKAEMVNKEFLNFLKDYTLDQKTAELFKLVILDEFSNDSENNREYKARLVKQLTKSNNKLTRARELLLLGDLESSDYKIVKTECDENIIRTEAKLQDFSRKKYNKAQLELILNDAMDTICDLYTIYTKSGVEDQRRLIGSMFKEKFNFDNVQHRTAEMTETFSRIYLIKNQVRRKKEGAKSC
ncbi:recombinase family protein [Pedobacter sp. KBS0701]|uniref:recombinase family protein n=1 Tax=Pedobacter sp. KBS0701 TaxID=2578106 RepID=UPI00110ECAE8|nr:recombinase family protein [Pedobacter sp. KBS0701]QDW24314.1 recombinase family protein [Pedobacter sp. KBS0701]